MPNEKLIYASAARRAILKADPSLAYVIDDIKAADAVEVVHAEWDVIEDDYHFDTIYKCSACKEEFVTIDGTPAENLWNYCPNCGAKMDGGNEDV